MKKLVSLIMAASLLWIVVGYAQTTENEFIEKGISYYKKNMYDEAIAEFTKAIQINPKSARAYYDRGLTYSNKGLQDEAISDYNKAIEINPKDAAAYYNRGQVYYDEGNYNQAISDYSEVIKIDPKAADAYSNRALAYEKKGLYDQAISDCKKAIELKPKDIDTFINLGFAYGLLNQPQQAITCYREVIKIDKDNATAYFALGIIYSQLNNYQEAKENYRRAKELWQAKGDHENIHEVMKAEKLLEKMIRWEVIRKKAQETKELMEKEGIFFDANGKSSAKINGNKKNLKVGDPESIRKAEDTEKLFKQIIQLEETQKRQQEITELPIYSILEEDKILNLRIAVSILVPQDISEEQLKVLLNKLYYSYKTAYENVMIWAYPSKEHFESQFGKWIAMISTGYDKSDSPNLDIDEYALQSLRAKPVEKFGFSEEQRKQIFKEIYKIEEQAFIETEKTYPPLDSRAYDYSAEAEIEQSRKRSEFRETLYEKYYNELARKYGLTHEQLKEIEIEGGMKKWPMPPNPELERLIMNPLDKGDNGEKMGISYKQVLKDLPILIALHKSTPVRGEERYMGTAMDDLITLELIGDKENLSKVSLLVATPKDAPDIIERNSMITMVFVANLFPGQEKEISDWTASAMDKLARSDLETEEKILDNKKITIREMLPLGIGITVESTLLRSHETIDTLPAREKVYPLDIETSGEGLAPPNLEINGVFYEEKGQSYAIVNQEVVRVGNRIEGVEIIEITKDSVRFKYGNGFFVKKVGEGLSSKQERISSTPMQDKNIGYADTEKIISEKEKEARNLFVNYEPFLNCENKISDVMTVYAAGFLPFPSKFQFTLYKVEESRYVFCYKFNIEKVRPEILTSRRSSVQSELTNAKREIKLEWLVDLQQRKVTPHNLLADDALEFASEFYKELGATVTRK